LCGSGTVGGQCHVSRGGLRDLGQQFAAERFNRLGGVIASAEHACGVPIQIGLGQVRWQLHAT
jgi:hypothetical protein